MEMLTLPDIVTFPDTLVSAPPDTESVAAESVNDPLARMPPDRVRVAPTVRLDAAITVPVVTVRLLKDWVMLMDALATKETVDVWAVKVAFAAVTVQLPFTVIVEDPAVIAPYVPRVTEPAVTDKFDVTRVVAPDGVPAEFCTVREAATTNPLVANVYVGPALPPESRVRL